MADQPSSILRLAAVGLAFMLAGGWAYAGAAGLAGAALGAGLAILTLSSLKLLVNSLVPTDAGLPKTSSLTVVLLLAKLPLVAVLIYLATRLPMSGITCFLASLGLVYSAFVWHLARAAT